MATSKKEPPYPSRDRATRISPNIRPSSSESSSGYGARRARSVPSSPDRKLGPSAAVPASAGASASPDMYRPSLSLAGRSISSRTMSSSGSSVHGSKPSLGAASKPTLARAKSDKATATSQRPPVLGVPMSNSFKDMGKTVAVSKSPSTLHKSKASPRPSSDKAVPSPQPSTHRVPSPKPSTHRLPSSGVVRARKTLPLSSAHVPGSATKKRGEPANGGASASSKARSVPQRAKELSATRQDKDEGPSMQFEECESLSSPSIEDHLHEQLPDPIDLKSVDMDAFGPHQRYQQEAYSDLQQQGKNEEVTEHSKKEDAGGSEAHSGAQGVVTSRKNEPEDIIKDDELERAEKEDAKVKAALLLNRTESWRKDDPKSNEVIEETKSKLLEERKSRVKALVGAFETVMTRNNAQLNCSINHHPCLSQDERILS